MWLAEEDVFRAKCKGLRRFKKKRSKRWGQRKLNKRT